MKFKFIISKQANFWFFISNLSEWHFSCRKNYNVEWLKKIDQLTEKENNIIKEFKKIKENYRFELDKYFYFYNEKTAFKKIKEIIKKYEFEQIKLLFQIFAPKFEKIWDLKELKKRAILIENVLRQDNYQNFIKDIKLFFNQKNIRKFNIIAILSPIKGEGVTAAGGANIDNNSITLEIPKLNRDEWEFEFSIGVLFHEIAHILFNQQNGITIIEKIIKKIKISNKKLLFLTPQLTCQELINESIIESLTPFGYLAQKYNKIKQNYFSEGNQIILGENLYKIKTNNKVNSRQIIKLATWQNQPLTIFYIKNKKHIDEIYIKEFAATIKKILTK